MGIRLHLQTESFPSITFAVWLLEWVQNRTVSPKILRSKIQGVTKKESKLRSAALDRFKEEAFTLPARTEEINPNPTSPDTPQIPDPVPSSSVTQPTLSSSQPCPDSPSQPTHPNSPPRPTHPSSPHSSQT